MEEDMEEGTKEFETRQQFIQGLRNLANHLEDRPAQKLPYIGDSLNIFVYNKEDFQGQVRALGTCDKSSDDHFLVAAKSLGGLKLKVMANHSYVCQQIVKGSRKVIKRVPPEGEWTEEEVTEDITEWVCPDSFLGGDNANS